MYAVSVQIRSAWGPGSGRSPLPTMHTSSLSLLAGGMLLCVTLGKDLAASSQHLRRTEADTTGPTGTVDHTRPTVHTDAQTTTLQNGFVKVVIDRSTGSFQLYGDFDGRAAYGVDTLAHRAEGQGRDSAVDLGGISIEVQTADGRVTSSTSSKWDALPIAVTQTDQEASLVIDGVVDDRHQPRVREQWNLSLARGSRSLRFSAEGETISDITDCIGVRRALHMRPTSIYALYSDGVVQMKGSPLNVTQSYHSTSPLPLLYTLGGWGGDLKMAGNASLTIERELIPGAGGGATVLSTTPSLLCGPSSPQAVCTRFEEVLAAPTAGADDGGPPINAWSRRSSTYGRKGGVVAAGTKWRSVMRLSPNNGDFPVHTLTTRPNLPSKDLAAMLTGIYASPVGNINSHPNAVEEGYHVAQMATTTHMPDTGYSGAYSFWDPDNYFATGAILAAGQHYLNDQVRRVLERSGEFLAPSGQLPHHFQGVTPTYVAISGETQPGPNIFWILSCFNYAKASQDLDWLRAYMPKLRHASAFLYNMFDPAYDLMKAPGSLFIDVFLRWDLTTDTNAMLVGFFREFADAELAVGNRTGAKALSTLADRIAAAVDRHLWSSEDDHFVTQLNLNGTIRDFVDYDANLIALAHGVTTPERAQRALRRIDGGKCTHGRATYVSEKYYGKQDTAWGNTGDSACSMGRIGWYDALARRRYGDLDTFDRVLTDPLRDDLLRWTWLHERYGCDGLPQLFRTGAYFEYPSVVVMLLRAIRYGIRLGLTTITVDPFGPQTFSYHVGAVDVDYSASEVVLGLPGQGTRTFKIMGLPPSQPYTVEVSECGDAVLKGGSASTDSHGVLVFDAPVGSEGMTCKVRARQAGNKAAGTIVEIDQL